jgi:serine O-acetyltransferase
MDSIRIESRKDLRMFIQSDKRSLGIDGFGRLKSLLNPICTFQIRLRKLEYSLNCQRSRGVILLRKFLFRRISVRLGFSISPNTFGPGLSIAHYGSIIVNGGARIGANCRIHVGVNIGTEAGKSLTAPRIGDNCYIGPGAKVFGDIIIGPNTVIGSNAVVNQSFVEGGITIAGVPARVVSEKSSNGLLIRGFSQKT